jgi:16S rRNA (guanine1516-N2)-methyltransferase
MSILSIAVFAESTDFQAAAEKLALRLNLPLTSTVANYDYCLLLTPTFLGLQKTGGKSLPLYIDFLAGKTAYRAQRASLRGETVARAMGLKKNTQPRIVDATAGLARDSFILATLGFEVDLIERSPIIHALLEDGLARAARDPKVAPIVKRMHLHMADANTWLAELDASQHPDIIYLDPMFPERVKSALVKKDMRIFHDVIGADADADQLLQTALTCATKRVVVKRPRLAEFLANLEPAFSQTGSSSRFDVYLNLRHLHGYDSLSD